MKPFHPAGVESYTAETSIALGLAVLLAGDIGGTKTTLILFLEENSSLKPVFRIRLGTRNFPNAVELIKALFARAGEERIGLDGLKTAAFACAGAVIEDRVVTNNLPWVVDAASLAKALKLDPGRTLLINDLVAAAARLSHLSDG